MRKIVTEGGEYSLIRYRHNNNNSIIKEIGMDDGVARITPATPTDITGIGSYGFASCIALLIKTADNQIVSLAHHSLAFVPAGLTDEEYIEEEIRKEVGFIREKQNPSEIEVKIGFSMTALLTDRDGPALVDERERFLQNCQRLFGAEIIDLPNSTIAINRNGEIDTTIPIEVMKEAMRRTLNISPVPSPTEAQESRLTSSERTI